MKKETRTLQEEVDSRKAVIPGGFAWWVYGILAHLPFFAPKYHPTYIIKKNPKDCPTGCFVIWNHLSRRDYLFLKVILGKRRFNMVAGYTEFFRSHLAWLFKTVKVIPKKPFYNGDIGSIVAMTRIIKKGGVITFSPEGTSSIFGDSQPITPGTAGFIKKMGVPVYCGDYRGQYLSSNKVDITDRPGKVEITMDLLFSPEDLKKLSADEITEIINNRFHHDDYEWNKEKQYSYKGKGKMASHLDDMIYECPKCHQQFRMLAKGDDLYCMQCGNGVHFDSKYNMTALIPDAVLPTTPSHWVQWERQNVIKEIRRNPNFEFRRHYHIGGLPKYELIKHKKLGEIQGEADFVINHEGVHFKGIRNGEPWECHMSWKEVYCPAIEDDLQTLTFYPNGVSTDIIIDDKAGGKIVLLIQEMHRFHESDWKNFSWFDYMYEDLDGESLLK